MFLSRISQQVSNSWAHLWVWHVLIFATARDAQLQPSGSCVGGRARRGRGWWGGGRAGRWQLCSASAAQLTLRPPSWRLEQSQGDAPEQLCHGPGRRRGWTGWQVAERGTWLLLARSQSASLTEPTRNTPQEWDCAREEEGNLILTVTGALRHQPFAPTALI